MKNLFNKLLDFYCITEEEFKYLTRDIDESSFIHEHNFKGMDDAIRLVKDTISINGNILIYGDYDADGIMGTSILKKTFDYYGYKDVNFYIPNRYVDGYGITLENAKKIAQKGYKLVICVDNGISAFEPIDYLRNNGVQVLVLDHHEIQNEVPNANVILHPFYSEYGKYSCSGACVAFNFSIHLLNRFDKYLSTLAAISTVSDMMPLREYNRDLLRLVFSKYTEGEFLQIDLLKNDSDTFNEKTIGMQIAPKINSIGRLIDNNSVSDIVKYFIAEDRRTILTYFTWIDSINMQRKELSRNAFLNLEVDDTKETIVEIVEEKEGLIGLIANSCISKYKKPTFIFTYDHVEDVLKGSCRSLPGFNVMDAFASNSEILLTFGGHSLAGGCSLKKEDFEKFKNRINEFAKAHPVVDKEEKSIEIGLVDVSNENYEIIQKFAPFGEDWKEPLFNLRNIRVDSLRFSKDGNHIITPIGMNSKIVGFNISKDELNSKNSVSFTGNFKESSYKGVTSLDFQITKLLKI